MTGYLVKYEYKTSFFFVNKPGDNFTKKRTVLVSHETLSRMLDSWRYLILSAQLVSDMDEYRDENGKQIEIITEVM